MSSDHKTCAMHTAPSSIIWRRGPHSRKGRDRRIAVISASCALGFPPISSHAQVKVDTNWWSNRTASANVLDPGNPAEQVRLGPSTVGFVEGRVSLPHPGLWTVAVPVRADEAMRRDTADYVDVFINAVRVGRAYNTVGESVTTITSVIDGVACDYRFEFRSYNTRGYP